MSTEARALSRLCSALYHAVMEKHDEWMRHHKDHPWRWGAKGRRLDRELDGLREACRVAHQMFEEQMERERTAR